MSVEILCRRAGMSRQNFYKARRKRQRKDIDAQIVWDMVIEERMT